MKVRCKRSSLLPIVCVALVWPGVKNARWTIVINAEFAFVIYMRSELTLDILSQLIEIPLK